MKQIIDKIIEFITQYFELWHFFILLAFFIIFILLVIFITSIHKKKKNTFQYIINNLDQQEHISVDLLNKTVLRFSTLKLSEKKSESLNSFLTNFDGKNRVALNRWILHFANKSSSDDKHLEQINYSKELKSYVKDVFVCRYIGEDNILHLDHYTSSLHNKRNPECPYLKSENEIERCFFRLKKNSLTVIGLLSFFDKSKIDLKQTYEIDRIAKRQIIEILLSHCDNNHLITLFNNGDIGIIILNYSKKKDKFLSNIKSSLEQFYSINMPDSCSFHITIYENKGSTIKYFDCIKKTRLLSNHLIDSNDYSKDIFYYQEGTDYPCKSHINAIERTKKQIQKEEGELRITPYFKAKDAKIIFFKIDMFTETMSSKEYCYAACIASKEKEYIELLLKKFKDELTKANDTFNNKSFIIDVCPLLIDVLIDSIDQFKDLKYHFIFNFENDDYLKQNREIISEKLKILSDLGFDLCITLIDCVSPFGNLIENAKYINISKNLITSFKISHESMILTNLLTKLSHQKKTIIATSIPDWTTFETLICKNITIFNGRFMEGQDKLEPEISKRAINKVRDIYRKYH